MAKRRQKMCFAHATTIVRSSYTWTHDNLHFAQIVRKTKMKRTTTRIFFPLFLILKCIVFVLRKLSRFYFISVAPPPIPDDAHRICENIFLLLLSFVRSQRTIGRDKLAYNTECVRECVCVCLVRHEHEVPIALHVLQKWRYDMNYGGDPGPK